MDQMQQEKQTCVIVAQKDVVASYIEEFRRQLLELLNAGCRELIIDLEKVQVVDSRGVALFMLCQNSLARVGGHLCLVTRNPDLQHLFRVMRLDQHITISEQVPA